VSLIEFSAMYYARFSVAYTQPYNEARRKRLFQAIHGCIQGLELDDERTQWFGHSVGAYGTFAGDEWSVRQAASALQIALGRMKIAKLVTREELRALTETQMKKVNNL
jgi:hypothetical protein